MNDMQSSCFWGRGVLVKTIGLCVRKGHGSNAGKGVRLVILDLGKGMCIQP